MKTRNCFQQIGKFLSVALVSATLAGALTLGAARPAFADSVADKGDQFLQKRHQGGDAHGTVDAIIQLTGPLDGLKKSELKALGEIYSEIPGQNIICVRISHGKLKRLADKSFVRRVSVDVPLHKNDEFTVENSGAATAFSQFALTGNNVTVAVVDTGIRPHFDLGDPATGASRIVKAVSFVNDGLSGDPNGHGTHVAGIIAGNGRASTGSFFYRTFYGIARKVKLVDVRVLDKYGNSNVSRVLQGIDWVIANKAAYNIKVMNLSLGHLPGESYKTDPLCQAVERAWKAGIVVVVAAGNHGRKFNAPDPLRGNEGFGANYGSINSPGNTPYCITVGAMKSGGGGRASDKISTFSSRGPTMLDHVLKPDLVAPGNAVIALKANGSHLDQQYAPSNEVKWNEYVNTIYGGESWLYFRLSGTSMATPVVAGAAALLLEKYPTLSPDTIKARLMVSADKWKNPDGTFDPNTYGAGYLNIMKALDSTVVATKYAVSPALYRDAAGNVRVAMNTILWGDSVIWGSPLLSSSTIIWGENVIPDPTPPPPPPPDDPTTPPPGDPLPPPDDTIIWGSTILWGDTILWGSTVLWGEAAIANIESLSVFGDPE